MDNTTGGRRTKIGKTLTNDDVAELSVLTGFTSEEIHDWHTDFLKDCPTGKFNKREFIHMYKQFFPNGKGEKYSEYVFRRFGNTSSGNIDFDKFLIAISIIGQQEPKKQLEWAFSIYDIDRNGFIERKEMKKVVKAICDLLGKERKRSNSAELKVQEIFQKMDTNRDGKLSKGEFISGCLSHDDLRRFIAPTSFIAPSSCSD